MAAIVADDACAEGFPLAIKIHSGGTSVLVSNEMK